MHKKIKKFFLATGLVVVLASLQLQIWGPEGTAANLKKQAAAQEKIGQKLALYTKRNQALLEEIQAVRKNPKIIEAKARQQLGMIRKDETFFFIPEESLKQD